MKHTIKRMNLDKILLIFSSENSIIYKKAPNNLPKYSRKYFRSLLLSKVEEKYREKVRKLNVIYLKNKSE